MAGSPFDAVLVVAFGGLEGMADVRPFLANVLQGRRVTAERIDEVAKHYEHFAGVSPLAAIRVRAAPVLFELYAVQPTRWSSSAACFPR